MAPNCLTQRGQLNLRGAMHREAKNKLDSVVSPQSFELFENEVGVGGFINLFVCP